MAISKKEVMNTKEVAEFLKLHPFTVNKFAREGKIPAFKIGADWRFYKKHIEGWIQEKVLFNQQKQDRRKADKVSQKEPDKNRTQEG